MTLTLCLTCNAPAPEIDEFQALCQQLMSRAIGGLTMIRLNNQRNGYSDRRKVIDWDLEARGDLLVANDFIEVKTGGQHHDCASWKVTYRRVRALCIELDFMRSLVRGIR
jgi:hypothetical protein